MTKHTPGPWKFAPMFRDDPSGRQLVREDGTGFAIAETFLPANSRAKHIDPKANAQLIAAAPELLEALRETLRELVTPKGLPDAGKGRTREQQAALTTAYAAIAKATGEAP